MDEMIKHWTGIIGIGMFILTVIEIFLYFIYSGPPPARNILTRIFINMFTCTGSIAFMDGVYPLQEDSF